MNSNLVFREHLQKELLKRIKKNPRFSIRAFARQLEVEPSSLAQILSGKRKLTEKMCLRFAHQLELSPVKVRSLLKTEFPSVQFQKFSRIDEDAFKVISEWHYYAILELTRTDHFKGNARWIAKVLGITVMDAHTAIERLKRLNYLEVDSHGRWIDRLGSANNLGNEYTTAAYRAHQRQLLEKAISALENIPYAERVQSSMMFVGSKSRIAEAKRRILNFIKELDDYMKSGESKDEVYTLSVSLFPISKTCPKPER